MPTVNRAVAEQAFRQAGFKRPMSNGDFANAQKFGTGIFAKSIAKIRGSQPTPPDELAQLQQQIDAAQGQYNTTQQTQVGVPTLVQQGLGQQSPEFNLPREALEARYGNPQSPLYIQNPFVRQAVIEKATSGQQQAFSTVADRVNQALQLRATIQQQQLGGLKDKYGSIADLRSAQSKAQQQKFENDLALKKFGLSEQELAIKRQVANRPTTTTPVSQSRSNVYGPDGKQIGFGLFNPKTGQTVYTNLNGTQSIQLPDGATVGTSPKASVNPAVRTDLVDDINGGATLDQLFNAYPEMSVSEITSIYNSL